MASRSPTKKKRTNRKTEKKNDKKRAQLFYNEELGLPKKISGLLQKTPENAKMYQQVENGRVGATRKSQNNCRGTLWGLEIPWLLGNFYNLS